MNKKISLTVIILSLFLKLSLAQTTTNPDSVCVGSTDYYKITTSISGSVYSWGVKGSGGTIVSGQNTDSINVQWINTVGTDTLWVVETNSGNCKGDTAKLVVKRFAHPTATISGNATLCNVNNGSAVTFNLAGIAPFIVVYKKNGTIQTQIVTSGNTFTIPAVPLTVTTVYELVSITDRLGCDNPVSGTATITVLPALSPLQIIHK